jgi:asparagine synthase (glutamine-hydrolysing)
MSGIAGVVGLPMNQVRRSVMVMLQAMIHRGPDTEGFEECGPIDHAGGCCGLGHRGLFTTDVTQLSGQPAVNPITGDVLAFDGFISGFQTLRFRLESLGYVFRGIGDAEVLLYSLQEWGVEAFNHIDGMYAVAWYEQRSHRLLLARDPLGIKPLYVARSAECLVFASEVRAILASGLVDDELDPAGIASFLAYGAPQDPLTVHRHIGSFAPGTFEWIDCGARGIASAKPTRFWRFPALIDPLETEMVAGDIHFEMSRQIRDHGVAEVPQCVFLSGGVYSSAVAAYAKVLTGALPSFHIAYQSGSNGREAALVAEVSHLIGARHYQTVVDDEWFLQQWDQWARSSDRPSVTGLLTYIISGAASDAGVVVALSGVGGSDLFCEKDIFYRLSQRKNWETRFAGMPTWFRGAILRALLGTPGSAIDPGLSRAHPECLTPDALALASRRISSDDTLCRFGFDWRKLGLTASYMPPSAFDAMQPGQSDAFHKITAVECMGHLGNSVLRDADVYGLANSLEIRAPLLSRSVVDMVASLPTSIKRPAGRPPRFLLGRVLSGAVPQSVLALPEKKPSLPFDKWLSGALFERCEAAIRAVCDAAPLDATAVLEDWQQGTGSRSADHRLALVCLGNYLTRAKPRHKPAKSS